MSRYLNGAFVRFTENDKVFVDVEFYGGEKYTGAELHRLFPISGRNKYISVLDSDGNEIGIIRDVNDLAGDVARGPQADSSSEESSSESSSSQAAEPQVITPSTSSNSAIDTTPSVIDQTDSYYVSESRQDSTSTDDSSPTINDGGNDQNGAELPAF